MNDRKKLEKKKERERAVRAKILLQREAAHKQAKADKAELMAEAVGRPKRRPFRKGEQMPNFSEKQLDPDEVKKRLEHNLQILKALEEEYDREHSDRVARNEDLEAQGLESFNEKLDAVRVQMEGKKDYSFGGEAGCRVLGKAETFGE